jgi:hypothetical protein
VRKSADTTGDYRILIGGGAGGGLDRWGMYPNQVDYPETVKSLDHHHFTLIDIDVNDRSYACKTYSLGHPDKPLACVLVDSAHRKLNQPAPPPPLALSPAGNTADSMTLVASPFLGQDSLMSSHFQLTAIPGNYSNPILNVLRDRENWYGDDAAPDYQPINLNAGISLTNLAVNQALSPGMTYGWRVRYRDENLRWSPWSAESQFTVKPDFVLSGHVKYDNAQATNLPSVSVKLLQSDSLVAQTLTNSAGEFSFPSVLEGSYTLACSSNAPWGGVNATDALLVLKHYVGMSALSGLKAKAADVNASQYVNSIDALQAARRFAGIISTFVAGDWLFDAPGITVNGNMPELVIKGICTGDVNGSLIP